MAYCRPNPRFQLKRRGSAIIEFAVVMSFLAPLLAGTFVTGMLIERHLQATELSRATGHMYAALVDFNRKENQLLIERLANGSRNGTVILSKIAYISDAECAAAGYGASDTRCVNRDRYVFRQQIVVGDSVARESHFGTPLGVLYDQNRNIVNYLTDAGARANHFESVLPLNPGESAYISEAYLRTPALDLVGYHTGDAIYARTIF